MNNINTKDEIIRKEKAKKKLEEMRRNVEKNSNKKDITLMSINKTINKNKKKSQVLIQNKERKEEKEEIKIDNQILEFPEGFLWGTSTSAHQIECENNNDWSRWEKSEKRISFLNKKGKNIEDYVSGKACNSYNRFEEDFDLAKELNTNSVRFSLEWSRIQPEKDVININEINHYKKVLEAARARDLKVVLTLWHWTNPVWLADEGGWSNKNVVEHYSKYVELIINELGGYVDYWCTLNEPMIVSLNGYVTGKWPPNKRNIFKFIKVQHNLINAHKKAYDLIHKRFPNAQVSISGLLNDFDPARKWMPFEVVLAKIFNYFWNHKFLKNIDKHLDYVGLDYYFHDRIVWYPPFKRNINKKYNDMGWEIYPKGIYHVLKYLDKKFKRPIIILENGIADAEDKYRADFIRDHLYYIHQAISEGVDVKGYFHWSLLDNFEWAEGYTAKFGLYKVDRKTLERTKRPSADVYAKICKENRLIY